MKVYLLIATLFYGISSYAQSSSGYKNELYQHLSVLAHDSMEGRETGTPGIEKAANYIELCFRNMELNPVKSLKTYRQVYKTPYLNAWAFNVMAQLDGEDLKDEYIVISAHYDHLGIQETKVYNGADDDGSGTAAVLTLAKRLKALKDAGKGPRRSILFVLFSGEEKGLWGSEYFSEHPPVEFKKISCDLNIDMIGRVDTERLKKDTLNYVYVVGHNRISSDLKPVLEQVNQTANSLTLDYKFDNPKDPQRIFYRSDHYNFARLGVPVLFFYDGMLLGDYHKPTDDIERIQWELYEKRTDLIFRLAQEMANRNEALKRDLK